MNNRPDFKLIASLIEPNSKVLDIGCGTGELLHYLTRTRQVDGRGIELEQSGVTTCVKHGLPVVQGDVDTDLQYYPDDGFDYVIASQMIQATRNPHQVLIEAMRIAKRVIIAFPNFGFWQNRLYLGLKGKMPMSSTLSYHWYETPNIHFCTITDFWELAKECGFIREASYVIKGNTIEPFSHRTRWKANLFGDSGVFVLSKPIDIKQ